MFPGFDGDQQDRAFETHTPVQIACEIPQPQRGRGILRGKAQPVFRLGPHHKRAMVFKRQHRTIEKLLVARQGNGDIAARFGLAAQAAAREVSTGQAQVIDGMSMIQTVQSVMQIRLVGRAENAGIKGQRTRPDIGAQPQERR